MKKVLALCALLATVLTGTALADTPTQLKFMAGPPGGNWFALGGELADLWSKEIMPTTSVTGGAVGNIINAKWTERENILGDLEVIMGANDFYAPLDIIGDAGIESIVKKLAQHGLYNDVNKANEYAGKTFHFTNNIARGAYAANVSGTDFVNTNSWKGQPNSPTKQQNNEAYAAATPLAAVSAGSGLYAQGYAVAKGSLGMLQRFERDCLLGTVSGDGHEWGIATLPLLNLPVGTYFYDSVGDYSGIAGVATADMVRTRKEHYGFAVDIAFVTPYNSDPTNLASPILGFNISRIR